MKHRRDPTRSAGLRRQGRAQGNRRVFELQRQLRMSLQDNDVIGLRQPEAPHHFMSFGETPDTKLDRGQAMLHDVVVRALEQPPDWLRELIDRSVWKGVEQVGQELRVAIENLNADEVTRFHAGVARMEVAGISGETQRRVLRDVASAIQSKATPEALMREVRVTLEKITRARLILLINTTVVRSVNAGKLFAYGENGVKQVGIVPEWLPTRHTHDAAPVLAAQALERRRRRYEAKQRRIDRERREAEVRLQELKVVHVLTAGDDRVCSICHDIAADAPYEINTALSLIPAHPNCRCAFVAFGDERFAEMEEEE